MVDILLTHSYFLRFDPKQWKAGRPYAPLATLFAGSVLRESGHNTAFFDSMFSESAAELAQHLEDHKPKVLVIYDDGFNYLTKMCLTNMREAAFEMIEMAKTKGVTVIISSSDSTDHSEKYLSRGADFVIVGEGEATLKELCDYLISNQGDRSQIHGLRYMENGLVHSTSPRVNRRELDEIPLPAWDLVDVEAYRKMWLKSSGYFSVNIGTTRGCPFKCNWCAKPIYGNRYNSRSPENVVEELKLLKQRIGFDHVWFCDDIFGLKPGWVKRFADLVEEEGLEFKFKIQSRADLLLQEENIVDLARAGAEEVWIGAESGSQKVLDAMDKGTTVEQIKESTRLMKKYGIKPCFFLQFGYPGEKIEDIQKTIEMVSDLKPFDIGVSVSYPLPGTKFYENVKSQLTEKQNWTDSDELLVMFEGEFSSDFYKRLQRYVHHRFRTEQAIGAMKSGNAAKVLTLGYRIPQMLLSKAQLQLHA
ncbi:MAG: radical SAM protein [Flavobacteriales bacterium]